MTTLVTVTHLVDVATRSDFATQFGWLWYVSLGDDKYQFDRDSSKKSALEIRDKIREFFSDKIIFPIKKILGFCLGLNFVPDRILSGITYRSCISYTII